MTKTSLTLAALLLLTICAMLPPVQAAGQTTEILLSFAGDCTFGSVNGDGGGIRFPAVYRRSGEKDYPFYWVKPWFLHDDLTVVNFECTLADASRTANKQWKFKGPARYASIFPAGSVEAVGLSNNHSRDYLQARKIPLAPNNGGTGASHSSPKSGPPIIGG